MHVQKDQMVSLPSLPSSQNVREIYKKYFDFKEEEINALVKDALEDENSENN